MATNTDDLILIRMFIFSSLQININQIYTSEQKKLILELVLTQEFLYLSQFQSNVCVNPSVSTCHRVSFGNCW